MQFIDRSFCLLSVWPYRMQYGRNHPPHVEIIFSSLWYVPSATMPIRQFPRLMHQRHWTRHRRDGGREGDSIMMFSLKTTNWNESLKLFDCICRSISFTIIIVIIITLSVVNWHALVFAYSTNRPGKRTQAKFIERWTNDCRYEYFRLFFRSFKIKNAVIITTATDSLELISGITIEACIINIDSENHYFSTWTKKIE